MTDAGTRRRIDFARWRSDSASGGNRYDDELVAALRTLGLDLHEHVMTGPWPRPEDHDSQGFSDVLATGDNWLVDNIVGSAAPEGIEMAVAQGRRVTLLMHYFPSDDATLSVSDRERLAASEAVAVLASSSIVVTSEWAAAEVASRYDRDDAVVAQPGVRPADIAPGSARNGSTPMVLWLGRLTVQKDPLTFVDALISLRDLDWTARLVGPNTVNKNLSQEVRDRIGKAGLVDRIDVSGSQTGQALEVIWASTDLLVHSSRSETYGMVVSEALARGIPSVVATGTGAVEAQEVGGTFRQGEAAALADQLRTWIGDLQLQERWRVDAADRRAHLPAWEATARIIASTFDS